VYKAYDSEKCDKVIVSLFVGVYTSTVKTVLYSAVLSVPQFYPKLEKPSNSSE